MPIAELYRQLTSFWDRARIDVVAHMLLAVVLMLTLVAVVAAAQAPIAGACWPAARPAPADCG